MKLQVFLTAVVALALAGCPSKNNDAVMDKGASAATVASDAAAAGDAAADAAPLAAKGNAAWSGAYTLAAGTISIPSANKDYAGVKQFKDDPSKHMGDGTIDLRVDGDGKVTGTVEGAAGPAIIDGSIVDGEIRGVVRRKDPKDDGLTGTIVAKISGAQAEGNLALADATTAIVREAKVSLKKK